MNGHLPQDPLSDTAGSHLTEREISHRDRLTDWSTAKPCVSDRDCVKGAGGRDSFASVSVSDDQCLHPLTTPPALLIRLEVLPSAQSHSVHGAKAANRPERQVRVGSASVRGPADGHGGGGGGEGLRLGESRSELLLFEGTAGEVAGAATVVDVGLRPAVQAAVDRLLVVSGFEERGSMWQWVVGLLLQMQEDAQLCAWLCTQVNMSMAFLNVLPLPYLDGGLANEQFLRLFFP
eukprot:gene1826-2143_t